MEWVTAFLQDILDNLGVASFAFCLCFLIVTVLRCLFYKKEAFPVQQEKQESVEGNGSEPIRKRDRVLRFGRRMIQTVQSQVHSAGTYAFSTGDTSLGTSRRPRKRKRERVLQFAKSLFRLHDPPPVKAVARGPPPALLEADISEDSAGLPPDVLYMLRSVRVFGHFEKPLFVELCKHIETRSIPAGAPLSPSGQLDESIYVVQKGKVTVFLQEKDGRELPLKDVQIGESVHSLLSILNVITGHSSAIRVSARAVESSTVLRLPPKAFQLLFAKYPDSLVRFVQIILLRLQRVTFLTLHKYLGLTSELIRSDAKASVLPSTPCQQQMETLVETQQVAEENKEEEDEKEDDEKTAEPDDSQLSSAPISIPRRASSVPDRMSDMGRDGNLVDVQNRPFSHSDVKLTADSGSDFELAYEKAGLRKKRTASSSGIFQLEGLGGKNEGEDVKKDDVGFNTSDDSQSDPAMVKAIGKLAHALDLQEKDAKLLFGLCSRSFLPPKTYLTMEGSTDVSLLFVLSGVLEVFQRGVGDTAERHMYYTESGEFAGELAVVTGEPSFFSIRVAKKASLLIISKAAFYSLMRIYPRSILPVAHGFIQKIAAFVRQIDFALDWTQLLAGKALYKQGDQPTTCNILLSGRLRSVVRKETGEKEIVAEYGRGDTIGVVELLSHAVRSTTVHAVRDTELAQISDGLMNTIKHKHPQVVAHLIHLLGNRLLGHHQSGTSPILGDRPQGSNLSTVAIIPVSNDVPLNGFTEKLREAIKTIGSSIRLTTDVVCQAFGATNFESIHDYRLISWLGQQEDTNRIVLYQADYDMSPWTQRCIRQADCILIVGLGENDPALGEIEKQLEVVSVRAQKELVLLHRMNSASPSGTVEWLSARGWCSAHHHIRCPDSVFLETSFPAKKASLIDQRSDFARLARRLTGTSIGLVLGGGGAKGMAQLGLLQVFDELKIPFDIVGGTSIGAFIGALYCENQDIETVRTKAKKWAKGMSGLLDKVLDLTYPVTSMFSGSFMNRGIKEVFGEKRIEDLWLPYFCVTTDVTVSNVRVHQSGQIWPYVRASMSLAGYMPPLCDPEDGHLLLDGGYVNNVPADIMHSMGAKHMIAIDVGAVDDTDFTNYGDTLSGWWLLFKKYNPFSKPVKVPNMAEIQARLAYVSCVRQLEDVKKMTCCEYIRPPIDKFKTLAFGKYNEIEEVGFHHGKAITAGWNKSRTSFHAWMERETNNPLGRSPQKPSLTSASSFTDLAEIASRIEPPRVPPTREPLTVETYLSSSDDFDSGEDTAFATTPSRENKK
ncbi:patatin-like phospholipase domain-containing protein 7 [Oscarella lobularis]|uniref:patatin-like phospholipase domain-containing protein 7 n=1 Tax=Oscarella lobularis TaxID=121494 RepID=UPI003314160A